MKKKVVSILLASLMMLTTVACGITDTAKNSTSTSSLSTGEVTSDLSKVNMSKWQFDSNGNFYYQIGLSYCETPADKSYETMGFYVPGDYFKATDNGDGTYTCSVNSDAKIGNYTVKTAPIIIPVNTPEYAAMEAPTGADSSFGYGNISDYMTAGMVIAYAGCRGKDAGAPAGVTDLKAAIRYTRYNKGVIPGDTDSIFSEGMSGGGAQSALLGSTGDSVLYDDYLKSIGAVTGVSDSVKGSMCWCPITNLDIADEAYEWNLSSTRKGLSDEEKTYSNQMAEIYAAYINKLALKDADGHTLTLSQSDKGIFQSGIYYDYMVSVVEDSLNHFLSDTTFPYTVGSSTSGGQMIRNGGMKNGVAPTGTADYSAMDNVSRTSTSTAAVTLSGTYNTAQDYIDALNSSFTWVTYDASTNKAKITSMADFTKALKVASKGIAAFDQLDASQGENILFGYGDGSGAHFDSILGNLMKGTDYGDAFTKDLAKKDAEGHTVDYRVNMYNPMYYLCNYYDGYQKSHVAKFWRIRTGINQGDTALCTETNLALALSNYSSKNKVDFATVWGQAHTTAERTGESTANFISWVNECMGQ